MPYAALEVWGWASYLDRHGDARRLTRSYRDLAWLVARRIGIGERRDTSFAYYEAMAEFDRSGAFDADPTVPGVQPEPDPLTYNGREWRRARELFLPSGDAPPGTPEYEHALAYYRRNAIPPDYAWNWVENRLEKQVFVRLIEESDQAERAATRLLGVILANHVLSAIDALITARLQSAAGDARELRIGSGLEPSGRGLRWTTTVRVTTGR